MILNPYMLIRLHTARDVIVKTNVLHHFYGGTLIWRVGWN